MIFLNYRDIILSSTLVRDTLATMGPYLVYILSFASLLLLSHAIFRIPKDIFRKLLHIAAFTSPIFVVLKGRGWFPAAITMAIFAALVYPALKLAERWKGYGNLFAEKHPGEVTDSLLLLFLSQAAFIAISCGLLKKPYILVTATLAWGLGDIAAAWVGRPYGRHKIKLSVADNNKSWEGSAAMAAVAFAASFVSLLLFSPYRGLQALTVALITALVSSFAEMVSKGGSDTVTVPAADILALWLISLIS